MPGAVDGVRAWVYRCVMSRSRTTPRTPFGERLIAAIAWSEIDSVQAFQQATNISHTLYRNADTGIVAPRLDMVEQWADALGVSPAWLGFGGVYPNPGRGQICAKILRGMPEPWLDLGRFREIFERGDASSPSPSEWAWVMQSWLSTSKMDLPHLAAFLAGLRSAPEEDTRTNRFYPGLAEFLAKAPEPPEGPTAEEKATLRSLQFPDSMGGPSPDAFRVLWEDMRHYQSIRQRRRG